MSTIDIDVATGKPLSPREQRKREAAEQAGKRKGQRRREASKLSRRFGSSSEKLPGLAFLASLPMRF